MGELEGLQSSGKGLGMLGSDEARGSSSDTGRLWGRNGLSPPPAPSPPHTAGLSPSHPPGAVDEEGLRAAQVGGGRPLAHIPLLLHAAQPGGVPDAALLGPPVHGII